MIVAAAGAGAATSTRRGSVQGTCKVSPEGRASNTEGKELPFMIEPASAAIDIWALGVMLFRFLAEEDLLPVNRNDDLTKAANMAIIADWDEDSRDRRLSECIKKPAEYDLLRMLLHPEKEERAKISLHSLVKTHAFFNREKRWRRANLESC